MAKLTLDFLQPLAAKLLSPLPFDRMDLFIEEEDFYPLKVTTQLISSQHKKNAEKWKQNNPRDQSLNIALPSILALATKPRSLTNPNFSPGSGVVAHVQEASIRLWGWSCL